MAPGESGNADAGAPRKAPNLVLRRIREQERHETREEFAEAMTRVARELGENVFPDAKYVARLETGDIRYPRPIYRRILSELCERPFGELGFIPPPVLSAPASHDSLENDSATSAKRSNAALRNAIMASGLELSQIARRVGVDQKSVQRWITRGVVPHPRHRWKTCEILGHEESDLWPDAVIGQSRATDEFGLSSTHIPTELNWRGNLEALADEMSELASWVETTNVGDGTLAYLNEATSRLAHDCLSVSPCKSNKRAEILARRVFDLLRSGHQHIGQTRELYVIAGKLCAVLSWLSSDLGELGAAEAHTRNGWTIADQADHDGLRALLLCAKSKNAFWDKRYNDAVVYARRGYEYNPPGTSRVLLACQEADALQALGNIDDARDALDRAERALDNLRSVDELGGIFGCGTARQANYSIATYLRAGKVEQALRQVERAESAWRNGEEWAYGTWAQVQIGASIAHLMHGDIDAAVSILQSIFEQPTDQHLATLTTRLYREVTPLLTQSPRAQSQAAISLRDQIANFGFEQTQIRQLRAGGSS